MGVLGAAQGVWIGGIFNFVVGMEDLGSSFGLSTVKAACLRNSCIEELSMSVLGKDYTKFRLYCRTA